MDNCVVVRSVLCVTLLRVKDVPCLPLDDRVMGSVAMLYKISSAREPVLLCRDKEDNRLACVLELNPLVPLFTPPNNNCSRVSEL
jgi:hypothetical protein